MARSRPATVLVTAALLLAACGAGNVPVALQPSLSEPFVTLADILDARVRPAQQAAPAPGGEDEAVPTRPDTTGSVSISTHAVIGARGMSATPSRPTPVPAPQPRVEAPAPVAPTGWQQRDVALPGTVDDVVGGYVAMLEVAGLETTTQVVSAPEAPVKTAVFAVDGDDVVAAVTVSAGTDGVLVIERWMS